MKSSPNGPEERVHEGANPDPPTPLTPADSLEFGFAGPDDDAWLRHVADAVTESRPGSLGEYTLLEEVGHGGQGVVYHALQPRTGREVALKLLVSGSFSSASARRRFEREVEAASSLDHAGLVTVYGLDEIDGVPVLAMEWVSGKPATVWSRGQSTRQVLTTFAQICEAVACAHLNGILHRDLKPSNVLIDEEGRPRVLDFGLARAIDDTESLTRSGGFVGTPGYAPPEQVEGKRVDIRGDVFSLGVLLYEMLTEERPYRAQAGLAANLRAMERADLERPSARRPHLSGEIDAVVMRALASAPEDRYSTASELHEDVLRLLSDRPVLAHPPSTWYEVRKLVRRNRLAAGLTLSLVVVLIAFSAVLARQSLLLAKERNAEAAARRTAEERRLAAEAARDVAQAATLEAEQQTERALANLAQTQLIQDYLHVDLMMPLIRGLKRGPYGIPDLLAQMSTSSDVRFAENHALNVTMHARLGSAYRALGMLAAAESEHRRAVALREELEAAGGQVDHVLAFTLAFEYGLLLADLGRLSEAAGLLDQAAALSEHLPDSTPALVAELERLAADTHLRAGQIPGASEGAADPEQVRAYARRVEMVSELTRRGQADAARQEAVAVYEWCGSTFGPDHELTAQSAYRAGKLFAALDSGEAEALLLEADRIYRGLYGEDNAGSVEALELLASHHGVRERLDEARAIFDQCVAMSERVHGARDLQTAEARMSYGAFLRAKGDPQAAIGQLRVAVDVLTEKANRFDSRLRTAREGLAAAHTESGGFEAAITQLQSLLADYEADGDPAPSTVHYGLGLSFDGLGDEPSAYAFYDAYFTTRMLEVPSARERLIETAIEFYAAQVEGGSELARSFGSAWRERQGSTE